MISISLQKVYNTVKEAKADIKNIPEGGSVIAGRDKTMYLKKQGRLVKAIEKKDK